LLYTKILEGLQQKLEGLEPLSPIAGAVSSPNPHQGLGQSPRRNRFRCIFALKYDNLYARKEVGAMFSCFVTIPACDGDTDKTE